MSDIYFEEDGKGPVVVLIHGFCETHTIWDKFVAILQQDFKVLRPDLPGFGESPLIQDSFSIDQVADHLRRWLDDIGIEKCIMIGHSLGGYVTLACADNHSECLAGFGLFHSTAAADSEEKKLGREKTIEFLEKNGVSSFVRSFVPSLFYYKNDDIKVDINRLVVEAENCSLISLINYSRAMKNRPDRQHLMNNSGKPILFICGEQDQAVTLPQSLDQSEKLDKSHVHVLKDTGHMGMFEHPELTVKMVQDFLVTIT